MENSGSQFSTRVLVCTSIFLIFFFISFSQADIYVDERRIPRDLFVPNLPFFGKDYLSQFLDSKSSDKTKRVKRWYTSRGLPKHLRIQIRSLMDEAQLGEMGMKATVAPKTTPKPTKKV